MKRQTHTASSSITMLVILTLFGFFLSASALITVSGADVYKSVNDGMEQDSRLRSSYAYIANRLRGNENLSGTMITSLSANTDGFTGEIIPVDDGECGDVLVLTDDYSGDRYYTRIYVYDGWLRESFLWEETPFYPGDGEKITEVSGFSAKKEGKRIDYTFTFDGEEAFTASICLRGES